MTDLNGYAETTQSITVSVEAFYLEYGRPIVIHIPPDVEIDEVTETRTYQSTINPFSMEIPGDMNQSTRTELMGDRFNGTGGEGLFIIDTDW